VTAAAPVLVVEDDPDVREAIREIVEYEGYEVAEASNGKEALEYLRVRPGPCLVLLDLMMPVMNGFDFLDAVARDPKLASLHVVILSAAARDRIEATVRAHGAKGYLTKPVQLETLVDTIKKFCPDGK
jgi:two-component system, chemotaxis family, chemotaxis protein CheY